MFNPAPMRQAPVSVAHVLSATGTSTGQWSRVQDAFGALEGVYFERRQAAKTAGATSPSQAQPAEEAAAVAEHASSEEGRDPSSGMLDDFSRDLHRFASHNDLQVGTGSMPLWPPAALTLTSLGNNSAKSLSYMCMMRSCISFWHLMEPVPADTGNLHCPGQACRPDVCCRSRL